MQTYAAKMRKEIANLYSWDGKGNCKLMQLRWEMKLQTYAAEMGKEIDKLKIILTVTKVW